MKLNKTLFPEQKSIKNKFLSLNFNLKNIIFSYLTFEEQLLEMTKITKKFSYALKHKKSFICFKKYFLKIVDKIDFCLDKLNYVRSKFKNCNESEETMEQIIFYFLKYKFVSYHMISLREEKENLEIRHLNKFIEYSQKLEVLDLYKNNLASRREDFISLCKAIEKSKKIERISFNHNEIGIREDDISHIINIIHECKTLKKLHLYGNNIGRNDKDFTLISDCLEKNKTLEVLSLDGNELRNPHREILQLQLAIKSNRTLKEIGIIANNIDNKRVIRMFKRANPNIKIV